MRYLFFALLVCGTATAQTTVVTPMVGGSYYPSLTYRGSASDTAAYIIRSTVQSDTVRCLFLASASDKDTTLQVIHGWRVRWYFTALYGWPQDSPLYLDANKKPFSNSMIIWYAIPQLNVNRVIAVSGG